jgi:3-methyladenine DNA glycosylase/8-oxoguanine DNA glycosylase
VTPELLVEQDGYAASAAWASIVAHAVPGLERVDGTTGTYERLVPVDAGVVPVTVEFGPARVRAWADPSVRGAAGSTALVRSAMRQWLDLDTDIEAVRRHLVSDTALAELVSREPGLRIVGSLDGFASAVLTVLGQQVTLAAARTFGGRLVERWGEAHPSGLLTFPAASVLAALDPGDLSRAIGLTGMRSRTVVALAGACADGLRIEPGGDVADLRSRLLALPGIGPWTVDYLALRVLRDADALPASDLVLRRALGATTARDVEERARPWSPYRAYAVAHLWHRVAYAG